jgi:peroxiredoxin Q/BCP
MKEFVSGDPAPDFVAAASNGKEVSLKDFRGKRVVLYFYPKDDTPGCTVQACAFRDRIKDFDKADAVVLGVSPDGIKSHGKFIEKFGLPFLLLADEDRTICGDYGVWAEKSMYGRKYFGVARTTFLIDRRGRIARVFDKVKPKDHAQEVMAALTDLE